jgi:hypothetical protein
MPSRAPLTLLVLTALLAFVLGPTAVRGDDAAVPVPLETAESELDILAAKLKSSKSINEEITAALDAVSNAYHNLEGPVKPEPKAVPDGASEEEQAAIEAENEKAQDEYETALGKFEREQEKFQKSAEKLFLKAFKLQKIHRQTERNIRDDVNIKAAQVLGATGSAKVAGQMQKALETSIFKAKFEVPMQLLEEAFAGLGKIGDEDSLDWMVKEFTHANKSPRAKVDQLIAAHKAMILFDREKVPGSLRYKLVSEMVKTYSGIESQASQSSTDKNVQAAKVFWDRIKNDAIKAVQYYAFEPKNEDEEVLATMMEFQDWFRDHKNPKKDPWKRDK